MTFMGEYSFFFFLSKEKPKIQTTAGLPVLPQRHVLALARACSEPCDTPSPCRALRRILGLLQPGHEVVPTCWWHLPPTVMRRWQAITSSGTSWAGLFSCTWDAEIRSFHLRWWAWGWSLETENLNSQRDGVHGNHDVSHSTEHHARRSM